MVAMMLVMLRIVWLSDNVVCVCVCVRVRRMMHESGTDAKFNVDACIPLPDSCFMRVYHCLSFWEEETLEFVWRAAGVLNRQCAYTPQIKIIIN